MLLICKPFAGIPIRPIRRLERPHETLYRGLTCRAYFETTMYAHNFMSSSGNPLFPMNRVSFPNRGLTKLDDTILDLWGVGPNRPPIDTHHPAVRTHPVTGLKALNVNQGFVTGFAELKKKESGKKIRTSNDIRTTGNFN